MSIGLQQLAWRQRRHSNEAADLDSPGAELSTREAALVEIAGAVVAGAADPIFQAQVEKALTHSGVTHQHIREVLRQIAPYAGLSATALAFERLVEMISLEDPEGESAADPGVGMEAQQYSAWALEGLWSVDPVFAKQLSQYTQDLWERPGLSKRERALVTLATDIVSNALGGLFAVHVALARQHGVTLDQVREMTRLLHKRAPDRLIDVLDAATAISGA